MNLSVISNQLMANSAYDFNKINKKRKNVTEKLSSGYRINKAADDAAGLSISEKMRQLVKGLKQGAENIQDGISMVQIGDGALEEVNDMLNRMTELSIKSLNGTNSESDRAAIQEEYAQLQTEINRISKTTLFNETRIFKEDTGLSAQIKGDNKWPADKLHRITSDKNDLTICYKVGMGPGTASKSIKVPPGTYSTRELLEEIEDALYNTPPKKPILYMNQNEDMTVSILSDGSSEFSYISGGLSYLLNESYGGAGNGTLLGTTTFPSDKSRLAINSENNHLEFTIQKIDGTEIVKKLTLSNGSYTKGELIDKLNDLLVGTNVVAEEHDKCIRLSSADSLITGFKGNMFKIDSGDIPNTSVFYDNIKYGNVSLTPAVLTGGAVLTTSSKDILHQKYNIDGSNNQLKIQTYGMDAPKTITIPEGAYSMEDMVKTLNTLFKAEDIGLTASQYTSSSYKGLSITTTALGKNAAVGIDTKSSAYDTLFVKRTYDDFSTVYTHHNTSGISYPSFNSMRIPSAAAPIEIKAGVNDTFKLQVTGQSDGVVKEYDLTVAAGTYTNTTNFISALNKAINDNSELNGKIKASYEYSNGSLLGMYTCQINGLPGSDIHKIDVIPGSAGTVQNEAAYSMFYTYTSVPKNTSAAAGVPSLKTNGIVGALTTFTATNRGFTVYEGGTTASHARSVNFTAGKSYTQAELLSEINAAFAAGTKPQVFDSINYSGSTSSLSVSDYGDPSSYTMRNYSNTGRTIYVQGLVDTIDKNIAAQVTVENALDDVTKIRSDCNTFNLSINGVSKKLTIDTGSYSRSELRDKLQEKIDEAFGTKAGGAIVSLTPDNKLQFTVRLNQPSGDDMLGMNTSISFSGSASPFIKEIDTRKTGAQITLGTLKNTITLYDDSKSFTFGYRIPDETGANPSKNATVTLAEGTYTKAAFLTALNAELSAYGIRAEEKSGKLVMTTEEKGPLTYLTAYSHNTSSQNRAFFADVFTGSSTPSKVSLKAVAAETITIDDSTNGFNIKYNGTTKNLTLQNGTYSRAGFTSMLNKVFSDNNIQVTAAIDSAGTLSLSNKLAGATRSVGMEYASAGSSMKSIFPDMTFAGLTASFDSDNKLVLTKNDPSELLGVYSSNGSIFQVEEKGDEKPPKVYETATDFAYIKGKALTEPVVIDDYNYDFKMVFRNSKTNYGSYNLDTYNISLNKGTYTFDGLKDELQAQIEKVVPDTFDVSVDSSGVKITCITPGREVYLSNGNLSGGFYDRVLNRAVEVTRNQSITNTAGKQTIDGAFAIGRRDINNDLTIIDLGINDKLSLDYTHGKQSNTFEFTITPGTYTGDKLVAEIQKQLNKEMQNNGFPAGMIKAQVGGVSTGVYGADDANALVFKLNDAFNFDDNGEYVIDGISGSAAFSIFYKSDASMMTAYDLGMVDISNGVTINPGENDFTFTFDGKDYSLDIPSGKYTAEELIDTMNDKLIAMDSPAYVDIMKGKLKIFSNSFGRHIIENVRGGASDKLFYEKQSKVKIPEEINIQCSGTANDNITLEQRVLSADSLYLRNTNLSDEKSAKRTLDRLGGALEEVLSTRSYFGSMQNRMEHAIAGNENTMENTQAAEAKIRDANMAVESAELSKLNLISEVSTSVIDKEKVLTQGVLNLLK